MKKIRMPLLTGLLIGLGVTFLVLGLNPSLLRRPGSLLPLTGIMLLCYGVPFFLLAWIWAFPAGLIRGSSGRMDRPGQGIIFPLACLLLLGLFFSNYFIFTALMHRGSKAFFIFLLVIVGLLPGLFFMVRLGKIKEPGKILFRFFGPLLIIALIFLFWAGRLPRSPRLPAMDPSSPAHPQPAENSRPVFFLALDGADWSCLDPLMERGELPAFAGLLERGSAGRLKTLTPTFSPIIWTSIATGKTPLKHGILNFGLYRLKGLSSDIYLLPKFLGTSWLTEKAKRRQWLEFIPVTSNMRRTPALWNILSRAGYQTGVVNWLVTMPAEKVNGFMISEIDYLSFMKTQVFHICHPPDLLSSRPGLGRDPGPDFPEIYNGLFNGRPPSTADKNLRLLKVFLKQDCIKIRTGLYLFQKFHPDFFTLYLHGLDAAQHFFWAEKDLAGRGSHPFGSVVPAYYQFLDRTLDTFMKRMDPRTVIVVCSDHGFRTPGRLEKTLLIRDKHLSGVHEFAPDGILILSGPPIKRGGKRAEASIYDVTPTILALMGLPAARDMDGKILKRWMRDEEASNLMLPPVPTYDGGWQFATEPLALPVDQEREERLKALGYVF